MNQLTRRLPQRHPELSLSIPPLLPPRILCHYYHQNLRTTSLNSTEPLGPLIKLVFPPPLSQVQSSHHKAANAKFVLLVAFANLPLKNKERPARTRTRTRTR